MLAHVSLVLVQWLEADGVAVGAEPAPIKGPFIPTAGFKAMVWVGYERYDPHNARQRPERWQRMTDPSLRVLVDALGDDAPTQHHATDAALLKQGPVRRVRVLIISASDMYSWMIAALQQRVDALYREERIVLEGVGPSVVHTQTEIKDSDVPLWLVCCGSSGDAAVRRIGSLASYPNGIAVGYLETCVNRNGT